MILLGEQPAVEAMYFLGVRRQEVPDHGGLPAGCGELVGLLVQVVAHHFLGAFTRQDLRGAGSLDAAARVNRDDRNGSLGHALGQALGELALTLSCEQGAEVLLELPTYGLRSSTRSVGKPSLTSRVRTRCASPKRSKTASSTALISWSSPEQLPRE